MNIQTSLPNIFTNDQLCSKIESFPQNIRAVTIDLFRFLFEEQINAIFVGDKSLRDTHYSTIYNNIHARICPFCGLSLLRSPSAPKHALDHYMPISKYPFVGSDLRNLPPMCTECNTDYKRDTDVLQDDQGNKRHCVDPYGGPTFSISLTDSQPFAGRVINGIHLPRWEIKFIGEPQEQAENWDRIFKIRQRYENNILDVEFSSWLDHFVCWYIKGHHGASLGNDIAASIPEYIETVIQDGLNDRAFLKSQVFTLIQKECIHVERGEDMKGFLEILVMTLG